MVTAAGRWAAWGVVAALTALVVANTLPYYSFGTRFAFFAEKGALAVESVWRTCFYVHITDGLMCLAAGPFLLWEGARRRWPALHRGLGRAYGLAVLGWAGPAGLVLSFHAKGGSAGRACFLLLAVLWWGATALAVRAILARRVEAHRRWMVRSYALALSAVFFRVFQVALHLLGVDEVTNYGVSLWLSLGASLMVGEAWVHGGRR